MITGKWFVIEENAKQKTARWGKVLQESDSRHPKMPGGVTKPDQRQTGNEPSTNEEKGERPIDVAENQSLPFVESDEVNERDWG